MIVVCFLKNCLNDSRVDWQKMSDYWLLILISYVEHFTDTRRQALIVDDSLFKREFSKKHRAIDSCF